MILYEQCNAHLFVVSFTIPLALKMTSKVLTPEFEIHRICREFSPKNEYRFFAMRIMKIQI